MKLELENRLSDLEARYGLLLTENNKAVSSKKELQSKLANLILMNKIKNTSWREQKELYVNQISKL